MGKNTTPKYVAAALVLLGAAGVIYLNADNIFNTEAAPQLKLSNANDDAMNFRLQDVPIVPEQIKTLAHGKNFTMILASDGRLFGSGTNDKGQLGTGTQEVVSGSLYQVKFPDDVKIVEVDTNDLHVVALDINGMVWTWGMNISGQIGDGTNTNANAPVKVFEDAKEIAAGYRMSGAVKNDGTLWVWGMSCDKDDPAYAQLVRAFAVDATAGGYYYGGTDAAELQACLDEELLPIASKRPRQVPGTQGVTMLTAGYGHFLWLNEKQELWSWGSNTWAQLGREEAFNGDGTHLPALVGLPEDVKPAAISAGFRHSAMVDTQGNAWVWGHNEFFETATNDGTKVVERPTKIGLDTRAIQISAGFDGTTILTEDKRLFAVGANTEQRFVRGPETALRSFETLAIDVQQFAFGPELVTFIHADNR